MASTLFLIPTPVGNLEDITLRALRLLKEVDVLLAEDTRTTGVLLQHYQIKTPMRAFHMHNEHQAVLGVMDLLRAGKMVGMVTDAGTPGISDPGFLLVREAVQNGFRVETLPGATAFVPALVSSGLPCDKFVFEGFLPVKKGRQTRLQFLATETRTMVFYESPHKLIKLLGDFATHFGAERPISCGREISKKFEEHVRGTIAEVLAHFTAKPPKGELVVVVGGNPSNQ